MVYFRSESSLHFFPQPTSSSSLFTHHHLNHSSHLATMLTRTLFVSTVASLLAVALASPEPGFGGFGGFGNSKVRVVSLSLVHSTAAYSRCLTFCVCSHLRRPTTMCALPPTFLQGRAADSPSLFSFLPPFTELRSKRGLFSPAALLLRRYP
jgi:hypothetical protein